MNADLTEIAARLQQEKCLSDFLKLEDGEPSAQRASQQKRPLLHTLTSPPGKPIHPTNPIRTMSTTS